MFDCSGILHHLTMIFGYKIDLGLQHKKLAHNPGVIICGVYITLLVVFLDIFNNF